MLKESFTHLSMKANGFKQEQKKEKKLKVVQEKKKQEKEQIRPMQTIIKDLLSIKYVHAMDC